MDTPERDPDGTGLAGPDAVTPLPGAIVQQRARCNKPGCRCERGPGHGPYHYRVWREGGRVRKKYIRPDDLERVRAACEAYRRDPPLREPPASFVYRGPDQAGGGKKLRGRPRKQAVSPAASDIGEGVKTAER